MPKERNAWGVFYQRGRQNDLPLYFIAKYAISLRNQLRTQKTIIEIEIDIKFTLRKQIGSSPLK
jgi:hypothetical protein